jgi:hypothetical protein
MVSGRLLEEVRALINRMRQMEYERDVAPLKDKIKSSAVKRPSDQECIELADRLLWAQYAHLRKVVPQGWLRKVTRIDVHMLIGETEVREDRIQLTAKQEFYVPPTHESFYFDLHLDVDGLNQEFAADRTAFLAASSKVNQKFNSVYTQVRDFLKAHRSLNRALKAWPDLALYIPQDYKDRVEQEVQRVAGAREIPQIDVSMLTTTAVMAKLGGSD